MRVLSEFALLGTNSPRTKAYLQQLAKHHIAPAAVILMEPDVAKMQTEIDQYKVGLVEPPEETPYFRIEEPVLYTLEKYQIPCRVIQTDQVNSQETIAALDQLPMPFVIYSGFGGQILRSNVFATGKKFLHIHPGVVPDYRGSTTIYYSLLKENSVGASAIFLNEKIDCGDLIKTKTFPLTHPFPNLDYIFDPHIRSLLLAEVIEDYLAAGEWRTTPQAVAEGETYYIIHPVLKHIAILSLENQYRKEEF